MSEIEELQLEDEEVSRVGRKVTFRSNLEDFEPDEEDEVSVASSAPSEEIVVEDYVAEEQILDEILPLDGDSNEVHVLLDAVSQLIVHEEEEAEVQVDDEQKPEEKTEELPEQEVPTETNPNHSKQELPHKTLDAPRRRQRPKSSPAVVQTDHPVKYKSCCEEKKRSEREQKLPKYMGDVSEYGLSRDQLEMKRERQERRRRNRQEVAYRKYQLEVERIRLNEESFAKWMRMKLSKMPRNKYANRYDDGTLGQRRPRRGQVNVYV